MSKDFKVGQRVKLRRSQTTEGGREADAGTIFRIIGVKPVKSSSGENYEYLLMDDLWPSSPTVEYNPNAVLRMIQGAVKTHTRLVCASRSALTKSSLPNRSPAEAALMSGFFGQAATSAEPISVPARISRKRANRPTS